MMMALHDCEGHSLPAGLPPVIDSHVHLFPHPVFSAVRRWFANHAWPIRYRLSSSRVIDFLLARGIRHVIALQYAHKAGMARELNAYMREMCGRYAGRVTGLATVFPGEEGAEDILREAFDGGLAGLKLHVHVQCFDMNTEAAYSLFSYCQKRKKPVLIHAGREPNFPAYRCDPYALCGADRIERVVRDFPELKICVPHLGVDELAPYRDLIERYDNLWLDTTMALAGYLPLEEDIDLARYRPDRIMYGSDFPNIPYAWDRELAVLGGLALPALFLEDLLHDNAVEFYGLQLPSAASQATGRREAGMAPTVADTP